MPQSMDYKLISLYLRFKDFCNVVCPVVPKQLCVSGSAKAIIIVGLQLARYTLVHFEIISDNNPC